ncbi:MAG: dUTP diphosphatase [Proteobacteria bacterium]|jgi:dUTP pyrophosphatase|nr:dUTP diphosphatase [Pseudomonadota bacterium]
MSVVVGIRRLPGAEDLALPTYQSDGAAGADLCAAIPADIEIPSGERAIVGTGIALDIPQGHEAQVRPRSGLAAKHGVTVLNAPGTIDSDYRGEVGVILINHGQDPFVVQRGDRIAQLVIAPIVQASWQEADALSETTRGAGGFGSTGTEG